MPLNKTTITKDIEVVESATCNKCHKIIDIYDLEYDEIFHYENIGGYTSPFGDGTQYEITLCSNCFHSIINPYTIILP